MQFFCAVGAIACSSLYFFKPDFFSVGIICMMVSAFCFYASLVFYNSYLPEIAAEEDRDMVSARGFTFGYIGSVLMQIVGFVLVLLWDKIPFLTGEGDAVRLTFLLVGIWWIGFAQIPFNRLPNGVASTNRENKNVLTAGFIELKKVFNQLTHLSVLKRFLIAFFFYNMGVQTVMMVAANFGIKELQLPSTNLIVTMVLIQLVAIAGAYFISKLSGIYGNLEVLAGVVVIWILVCIAAYFMKTEYHFYALAVAVGLVMGGIQSLSRSTYSKLMPPTKDTASFFSFYDVTEKVAIVIGLTSFGYIEEFTGSMRNSILCLIFFFTLGLIGLMAANNKQKKLRLQLHEAI
jgi:UMF1 family MFS transporter